MFMRQQHFRKGLNRSYNSVDFELASQCTQSRSRNRSKQIWVEEQKQLRQTRGPVQQPQQPRRVALVMKPRAYY